VLKSSPFSRRANAETVTQRALDTICASMQCKGLLLLGEIVEAEGDDERDVFISM
jgi:DNA-binding Xre family transcriptional regulator